MLSTTYGTSTCVLYTLHLEDAVGEVTVVNIVPRTGPLRAEYMYMHIYTHVSKQWSLVQYTYYTHLLTHSSTYPLTHPSYST